MTVLGTDLHHATNENFDEIAWSSGAILGGSWMTGETRSGFFNWEFVILNVTVGALV